MHRLLELVGEGCPGHGPVHLLVASASEVGFQWDPLALGWSRPGLPLLRNLACLVQHFGAAILDAWRGKVATDLCDREGFRGVQLADFKGSWSMRSCLLLAPLGWVGPPDLHGFYRWSLILWMS